MPPKPLLQPRAWGTRYDSLPISPPISPRTGKDEGQRSAAQNTESPSDEQSSTKRKDDKLSHDASIFIGSLPSNMDPAELTSLLTDHLSEYAGITNIKVVRDSRGGMYSFVQCEDATAAAALLQSMKILPPKPFLGRTLRYEPARAFRTLLVSYRTPTQTAMVGSNGENYPGQSSDRTIELELPTALRLWKPRNSRYHRILYNSEAIDVERCKSAHASENPALCLDEAVYLHPLHFDAESIIKLARYFGPLDKVTALTEDYGFIKFTGNDPSQSSSYPAPHNAKRGVGMDPGCWEIKWEYRVDCVTALMVLRRIPHLSVSWAHQHQTVNSEQWSDHPKFRHVPTAQSQTEVATTQDPDSKPFFGEEKPIMRPGSVFSLDNDRNWTKPVAYPATTYSQSISAGSSSELRNQDLSASMQKRINWAETDFSASSDPCFEQSNHEDAVGLPSVMASQSATDILDSRSNPAMSPSDRINISPGFEASFQVPFTPIMQSRDLQNQMDSFHQGSGSRAVREIDPTTLFVGGLETCGPDGWNEEKLRAIFGRFGGLEHITIVRPANGNIAFAFIKYDNTESPAQAILEEHNRVYAGRTLRVRLRDINPHRGSWSFGRGRGRLNFNTARTKRSMELQLKENGSSDEHASNPPEGRRSASPSTTAISESEDKGLAGSEINNQESGDVTKISENLHSENYREWYDTPISMSPPRSPASMTPTNPSPAAPYPMPGYYMPWIHPYGQPGHYPVPFYGPYPGYPLPVPTFANSPSGSDASSPVFGGHPPWPPIMYSPYAPYFGPPTRSTIEPTAQINGGRAPLTPSGFVQNEQGTLIAVYAQDALDNYMYTSGGITPVTSVQSMNIVPPGTTSHYPLRVPAYSQPLSPSKGPVHPPWNPVPAPLSLIQTNIHPNQTAVTQNVSHGHVRSGENRDPIAPAVHLASPLPDKRCQTRGEFHNRNFSQGRGGQPFDARNGRRNMHYQGIAGNVTGGPNPQQRNFQGSNVVNWNPMRR